MVRRRESPRFRPLDWGNVCADADDTPGLPLPICQTPGIRVTYYLFAPQGSGEAESFTPLKRRTTSHITHL